jgi:hypothetical protein
MAKEGINLGAKTISEFSWELESKWNYRPTISLRNVSLIAGKYCYGIRF